MSGQKAAKRGKGQKFPGLPLANALSPKRVTRARADSRSPTKRERVAHILGMMERLEWQRGKSGPVCAEFWGIALSTVEADAAEASRRVIADRDEATRDISVGARKLFVDSVNKGNVREATAIGELWAKVSGARAPEEHIVTTATAVTPAEAARLVREAFGEKHQPKPIGNTEPGGTGAVPKTPHR